MRVGGPDQEALFLGADFNIPDQPAFGAWIEGFGDYEKRTGSTAQTQRTLGTTFGIDRRFYSNQWGIQLGLLGGYSKIQQDKGSVTRKENLNTDYDITSTFLPPEGPPDPNRVFNFRYTLPTEHEIESSTRQTLDGLNLGVSLAFFKNGFFSDWLAKVDFFDVRRRTQFSDTFNRTLNGKFQINNDLNGEIPGFDPTSPNPALSTAPDVGCLNKFDIDGNPIVPFTLDDPATTVSQLIEETTLRNYVIANNFGVRFDFKDGYWLEPSAGIQFTYSDYGSNAAALGLKDGYALRVEAGAKVGNAQLLSQGAVWSTSVGAYLYTDVLVDGLVISTTGSTIQTDEGKIRAKGIFQSRLDFANGVSAYAEFAGRVGEDYKGVSGKLGGRIEW